MRSWQPTTPDMGSWQYQYDAVGNLTGQKDGRNQWVYLAYDDLNRLSNKRQDNPTTGALIADYTYDAVGQKGLLSFSRAYSAQGTTQLTNVAYDTRNRLTQQTWSVPGTGGGTFRMDYAYNEANQRTSLTYPGGNAGTQGETVTNSYNAIGQLTGVAGLAGIPYISSATYNAQGQLTQLVNENGNGANGLTRQWSYETNTLRLSTLQAGTNATFDNLQKLTYSYDNAGNVSNLVDTPNSSQKQCFQYDWLDRLTGAFTGDAACATYSATGTGPYNHTYAYDTIGNITSNAGNAYTYGDLAHKHAVTAAFGNSYGYDANGNQTTRTIGGVTYTFTYDYENHLTAVSGGSISASFVYDADGNRVKGTVNGTTTVYLAGVYEYQSGATTLYYEGNALRRTGYATDNGVFYLLQDQLKSSSVLTNQNGTVNSRNYFYPFGGNRGGAAFSSLTTKRFTGQYHEAGLPGGEGLSYYGARWYDAQLGRFASADSLVPSPSNPQTLNRYGYVLNNPIGRIDPTGHYDTKPGDDPWWNNTGSSSGSNRVYLPIVSNGGGAGQSAQSFFNLAHMFLNYFLHPRSSGVPELYIVGTGGSLYAGHLAVEQVYDFSRNEVGHFYMTGYGAGSDSFSASLGVYFGKGWKNALRPVPIDQAYSGGTITITGTLNKFDIPVSFSGSVSADKVTNEIWTPRFDHIVTMTGGLGVSKDLSGGVRRDIFSEVVDGRVSFVNYTSIGRPLAFANDWQMIWFIWAAAPVPMDQKIDMTIQALQVQESR